MGILWDRVLEWALGSRRILVLEGDLSDIPETPPPPGVEIGIFLGDDWSRLSDVSARRHARTYMAASEAGRVCLVAWEGERAVGCAWLSPSVERRYESVELPLPRDAVYLWHVQVARSDRGRGISASLGSAVCAAARRRGARRIWMGVHSGNRTALRAATRMGLERGRVIGSVAHTRVLRWSRFAYRALREPVPVALVETR